jgi:hypothetical protein
MNLITGYAGFENKMAEDCLSINVWTKPQTGERKKGKTTTISYYGSLSTNNLQLFFSSSTEEVRA